MAGILDKKPHLAPSCLLHHPYIFLSLFLFFQDHSPTQPCFRGRPGRRGEGFLERKIETLQNKMARVDSLTLKWFALVTLLTVSSSDLAYPQPQEDGLVINGDFETVPTGGFAGDGGLSDGPTSIPGWRLNGTVELVESGQKQGGMILIVPEGRHAIRLGNDAEIRQDLKVEKGALYSITFSAARTCAQLESLNVSVPPGSVTIDLQTLYNIQGWDAYASAFQAEEESIQVVFRNPGMEDDPTCGPIIDDIAVKKLFTPEKPKGNAVLNGDFEEGPWMFRNESLGVLLPTNLDDQTSSLPGWIVESNRAVRYIDSYHFSVPEGKRAIELLSGKEGIISQMVETKPDKEYRLSFALGHAGDSCKQPLAIMAFAGDQSQNVHYTPNSNSTFQVADVNFTAKAERTRIAFYSIYYNTRSDDMSSLCGPVVDDVRVALSRSVVSGEVGRVVGLLGLCLLLLVLG